MLRFYVFDQDTRPEWSLEEAFLVGKGDAVLSGQPLWKNGVIECASSHRETYGLALRWRVGDSVNYLLQTCLLAPRKEPYVLSLELARHRIKIFLDKCESWQMFTLGDDHPAMIAWEKARKLFVEAVAAQDSIEVDKLATRSLALGIEATDQLALRHAEILFKKRYELVSASSGTLGTVINFNSKGEHLEKILKGFDLVSVSMPWCFYESSRERVKEKLFDFWIQRMAGRKKVIVGGPLLCLNKFFMPEWAKDLFENDFNAFQDVVYEYGESMVQRYRGLVKVWTITSGLASSSLEDRSKRLEITRMLSVLVRQNDPSAKIMIEVDQPWGDYRKQLGDHLMPSEEVEWLRQEGIKFHFVGLRFNFGKKQPFAVARDLLKVSDLLDQYHHIGIPIIISSAAIPSSLVEDIWKSGYSEKTQAIWAQRFLILALSKPTIKTFIWGSLGNDIKFVEKNSGLVDHEGNARPALLRMLKIRRRIDSPLIKGASS